MQEVYANFKVYEDNRDFLGIAEAALPDLTYLSQTLTGAGMAGNVERIVTGHVDAMTLGLTFHIFSETAMQLAEPRNHAIDLRIARDGVDQVTKRKFTDSIRHSFVVEPKSIGGGTVAPASTANISGQYSVHYWKTTINGKRVMEIDPENMVCYLNGRDYLAPARAALGM